MEDKIRTGISEEVPSQENQEIIKLKHKEEAIEETKKRSFFEKVGDFFKTIFARIVLGREGYMRAYERAEAREAAEAVRVEHARQVAAQEKNDLKIFMIDGMDIKGNGFQYEVEALNEKEALDHVKDEHGVKIKSVRISEMEINKEQSVNNDTQKESPEQNAEDQKQKEPKQEGSEQNTEDQKPEQKGPEEEKQEFKEEPTEEVGKVVPFTDPEHVYASSNFAGQTQGVEQKYVKQLTGYLSKALCIEENQIKMSNIRNSINGDHSYLEIGFNSEAGDRIKSVYIDAYGNSLNQNFEYNKTGFSHPYNTDFSFRVARLTQEFNAFYYIDKEDRTSLTAQKYSLYREHVKEFVKEASHGDRCMLNDVELRMLQSDKGFMITLNGTPAITELPKREDLYKNNVQNLLFEKLDHIMTENVKEMSELVGARSYMTNGSLSDTVPSIGWAYVNLGSESGMTELIQNSLLEENSMQPVLFPDFEVKEQEKVEEQSIPGAYNPLGEDPAFDPKDTERMVTAPEISDSNELHAEYLSRDEMDDLGEPDL